MDNKELNAIYRINYNPEIKSHEENTIVENFSNPTWSNIQLNDQDRKDIEDLWSNQLNNYQKLPDIIPNNVRRFIVIGDIHGDFTLAKNALKIGKVIDNDNNWIGDDTIVIQIGDQLDRCRPTAKKKCGIDYNDDDDESDILTLNFFTELHNKALKHGGAVYSLLGNHEIMNCQGNLGYVSFKGLQHFENYVCPYTQNNNFRSAKKARKYAFKPGNEYAKILAGTRQSVLIIGDNLFVHAGLFPELARNCSPQKLNLLVRKWLLGTLRSNDRIENIGSMSEILNSIQLSPFWPRVLGNLEPGIKINDIKYKKCTDHLSETLKLWGIKRIFVGHTPQFHANKTGLNSTCNNNVWRVDTGSSEAFKEFETNKNSKIRGVQVLECLEGKFNILTE